MTTKITKLKNNIEFAYKRNPDTPRVAFYLNFSLNNPSSKAGVYSLMVRLFMQGTKNRTAQQLSEELDKYAIEFSAELKLDYVKFKFVCLNEDFEHAIEIFEDIVKNTTFEEFEKERTKLEGEIIAELDSPRAKIIDSYYKNIYEGHNYGFTNTVILENLKNLTQEDVKTAYKEIVANSKKVVAFVGDLDFDKVNNILNEKFAILREMLNNKTYDVSDTSCKVTVTYFVQDELKEGGHYERYSVYLRTIDDYDRILIMHGGKNIKIADIIDIIADIYSDVL